MKLTANKLELYNIVGRGKAANKISSAVTTATKIAIAKIGRRFNRNAAARAVCAAFKEAVEPVLSDNREYGAFDSEPIRAVYSELCNRVAKRYKLEQWENDELYYSVR